VAQPLFSIATFRYGKQPYAAGRRARRSRLFTELARVLFVVGICKIPAHLGELDALLSGNSAFHTEPGGNSCATLRLTGCLLAQVILSDAFTSPSLPQGRCLRPHRKHGFPNVICAPASGVRSAYHATCAVFRESISESWKSYFRHRTFKGSYAGSKKLPVLNVHLMIIANHSAFHTCAIWLIKIACAGKVLFEAVSSFWTHQRGHTSSDYHSPGRYPGGF